MTPNPDPPLKSERPVRNRRTGLSRIAPGGCPSVPTEAAGHTLQPTELVHEAFLRLCEHWAEALRQSSPFLRRRITSDAPDSHRTRPAARQEARRGVARREIAAAELKRERRRSRSQGEIDKGEIDPCAMDGMGVAFAKRFFWGQQVALSSQKSIGSTSLLHRS